MSRIAVVILNYNGASLLERFLPLVLRYSSGADIVVADNGSTDDSCEKVRSLFPQVKLLSLEKNYGFCGGYNRALAAVSATYYVLLNSDVEVTPGWLDPLVSLLDARAEIAVVQPKILSLTERTRFEYAGAGGGFIDALGYPFCRGRIFQHVEFDGGQYDDEREVFWTSGACMIIRSEVFHSFGGFDEDFFAHMEEIDLCWKINRTEKLLYYTGKSHVYHLGAGTLSYQHPRKTFLNFRNGLMMLFKHLDTAELLYKLPLRIVLDWLAAFMFLIRGDVANCGSVLRAHLHFARRLASLSQRRRAIRTPLPRYRKENIYGGLIVFDYYFRRKRKSAAISNPKRDYAS